MKIGVLTAMTSEFEQLAAMLEGAKECLHNNISYLVGICCGVVCACHNVLRLVCYD